MNFLSLQKRFMNFRGYQRAPNEKKNSWKIKSLWCSMIKLYFNFFFIKNLFSLMWALVWLFSYFFNISPFCKQILCDGGRWKYLSLVEVRAGILSVMRSHRFSPWKLPSLSFALYLGPSILLCRFTLRGNSLPSEEKQISISILMEKFVFWRMRI